SGSPNRSVTSAETHGGRAAQTHWNRGAFTGVLACMGQPEVARVDVAALHAVARECETVADIVESAGRTHHPGVACHGGRPGRMPRGGGDARRAAVDRVVSQLRLWSRAPAEIAAALRASADRYAEADAGAARRLG